MPQVVGGVSVDLLADAGIIVREMERASRSVQQASAKMQSTSRSFDRTFSSIQNSAKGIGSGLTAAFRQAGAAAAAFGVALGTRELVAMADAASLMRARLNLVTKSAAESEDVFQRLANISLETRSSFQETAGLYTQLANATSDLGASSDLLLEVTDNVSKALIVSGANAASTSAALLQLSQALGSGVLKGTELNSVLEQARPLAVAIAQELGVTVGQLKKLGEQNKITTDVVLAAFVNMGQGADNIDDKFAKIPVTIGQAFTNVRNAVLLGIDAFDQASNASSSLATKIDDFAKAVAEATVEIASFVDIVVQTVGPIQEFFDALLPDQIDTFTGRLGLLKGAIEAVAGAFGVEFAQAAPIDPVSAIANKKAVDLRAELEQIKRRAKEIAPATKEQEEALKDAASAAKRYRETIEDLEFAADFAGQSDEVREFAGLLKDLGVQATVTASASSGLEDLLTIGTPTGVEQAERLLDVFKRAKEAEAAAESIEKFSGAMADLQAEAQIAGLPEEVEALGKALQDIGVGFEVEGGSIIPIRPEDAERIAAVRAELERLGAAEGLREARDASREFAEALAEIRVQGQLARLSEETQDLAAALVSLNIPFAVEDGSIVPIRDEDVQRVAQLREELEKLAAAQAAPPPRKRTGPDPSIQEQDPTLQADAAFAKKLQDDLNEATYEAYRFESAIGDAMGAMILEGADAGDTMQALARRIRDMVIEMLIIMPIAQALGRALQGAFAGGAPIGGLLFGGFRQHGGSTQGGKAYVVGEKGPELWMDNRSGFVVSNDNLKRLQSGSGGNSVNIGSINQDNRGATAEMAQVARRAAWDMIPAIQQAVAQKAGHDPKYRKALRGRG